MIHHKQPCASALHNLEHYHHCHAARLMQRLLSTAASQGAVRLSWGSFLSNICQRSVSLQQAKSEAGWARGQGGGRGRGRGDAGRQHFQTVFGGGGSQHSESLHALQLHRQQQIHYTAPTQSRGMLTHLLSMFASTAACEDPFKLIRLLKSWLYFYVHAHSQFEVSLS